MIRFDTLASYLYLPGHRLDRLDEALASAADALVLDLENLVPAEHKPAARDAVARVLQAPLAKPVLVRVNGSDSPHHAADIAAACGRGLAALRLPKAEDPAALREAARRLDAARSTAGIATAIALQPMIESVRGLAAAEDLARATHLVGSLGLGEGDFNDDLGVHDDLGLAYARGRLVAVCRAAGLPPPVQVTAPPNADEATVVASTQLGRRMGFGSRSLLSAWHAAAVHRVYRPAVEKRHP